MGPAKRRLVDARLTAQQGVVAWWQLASDGLTEEEIRWEVRHWRDFHRGVYLSGHAPPTAWQRWYAATVTAPGTALARWSLAAHLGLREASDGEPAHVVRPGSGRQRRHPRKTAVLVRKSPADDPGQPRSDAPGVERPTRDRLDALWVKYSTTLDGDLETRDGMLTTTPARCLHDLFLVMSARQRDRLFRDAVRLRVVTRDDLREYAERKKGRPGIVELLAVLDRYREIPIERTRSDPEIEGLVVLHDAGVAPPLVNVEIAGAEADIVLPDQKKILELDGPQYHQFSAIDAAKRAAWEAAGWAVERFATDTPYDHPGDFARAALD